MSNDFILKGIKDILNHGINLDLNSIEEEEEYLQVFMDWYVTNTSYYCCQMETNSCMIETKQGAPLAEIYIEDSIMRIAPHDDDLFGIITEILRFVAKEHQKFIDNFRGLEKRSTITSPSEINKKTLDSEEEISTEEDEWL
tara:strand:- start:23760 stop:24182 length:423 start_codon:yes stop_codon:yes gene_type:complete